LFARYLQELYDMDARSEETLSHVCMPSEGTMPRTEYASAPLWEQIESGVYDEEEQVEDGGIRLRSRGPGQRAPSSPPSATASALPLLDTYTSL
jgi:hypothetical protein